MTSVWMHVHMQIFTHKGENVKLQLRKQPPPPFSGQAAASGWMEQFKTSSNFEVSKVVACLTTQLGIIKDE